MWGNFTGYFINCPYWATMTLILGFVVYSSPVGSI
jgi:hypothetical protein